MLISWLTYSVLGDARLFGQSFEFNDLFVVGLLVVLEGVLSIDNALVLGLLARRLPKQLQGKALTYGLIGALIFRVVAIGTASFLLKWNFAKFAGGAYLVYVAIHHFVVGENADEAVEIGADGAPLLVDSHTHQPKSAGAPISTTRSALTPRPEAHATPSRISLPIRSPER